MFPTYHPFVAMHIEDIPDDCPQKVHDDAKSLISLTNGSVTIIEQGPSPLVWSVRFTIDTNEFSAREVSDLRSLAESVVTSADEMKYGHEIGTYNNILRFDYHE